MFLRTSLEGFCLSPFGNGLVKSFPVKNQITDDAWNSMFNSRVNLIKNIGQKSATTSFSSTNFSEHHATTFYHFTYHHWYDVMFFLCYILLKFSRSFESWLIEKSLICPPVLFVFECNNAVTQPNSIILIFVNSNFTTGLFWPWLLTRQYNRSYRKQWYNWTSSSYSIWLLILKFAIPGMQYYKSVLAMIVK